MDYVSARYSAAALEYAASLVDGFWNDVLPASRTVVSSLFGSTARREKSRAKCKRAHQFYARTTCRANAAGFSLCLL